MNANPEKIGAEVNRQMVQAAESSMNDTERRSTAVSDKLVCECPAGEFRGKLNIPCVTCQPNAYAEWFQARVAADLEQSAPVPAPVAWSLPPRMRAQRFENYQAIHPGQQLIVEHCLAYAEQITDHLKTGKWLLLHGPCGTGKGHLAAAIAQRVIEVHGVGVIYVKLIDLVGRIKETWGGQRATDEHDRPVTEESILAQYRNVDLLILDEIGVQFGSDTERLLLYRVLDSRYEWLRPTILTSNLTLAQLKRVAGQRIYDRLSEPPNEALFLNWPSYRQKTKQ